jgi:hypothetical protein
MKKRIELKFSFDEVKECLLELLLKYQKIDDSFKESAKIGVDNDNNTFILFCDWEI